MLEPATEPGQTAIAVEDVIEEQLDCAVETIDSLELEPGTEATAADCDDQADPPVSADPSPENVESPENLDSNDEWSHDSASQSSAPDSSEPAPESEFETGDPLAELAANCARQRTVDQTHAETAQPSSQQPSGGEIHSLEAALRYNTQLIEQLIGQVGELQPFGWQPAPFGSADEAPNSRLTQADDEIAELRHRNDELIRDLSVKSAEINELKGRVVELQSQSDDLASQIVTQNVRQTIATSRSGSADAMSWEERKQLIFQQMENDTFDANEFVQSLSEDQQAKFSADQGQDDPSEAEAISPIDFVGQLSDQLEQVENELASRNQEISELKMLLEQQSETRDSGIAIGAAAIAQMVDADELVAQERERLQQLQDQWEEKFRKSEIEASLERAKLSRERQEVAKKNQELQEQLAHFQREARQSEESGGATSRRWFAKLGLAE